MVFINAQKQLGGQVEQRCPPSRLGLLSYPVVNGSGDAPALLSGAPAGTAAAFLITTSPSQPSEGCTGSFLGPKFAALYGNGHAFALLHAKTLGMASTTPGVTAGGADARGGNAELCWDLFSKEGVFLQRNISSSNMEFKMKLQHPSAEPAGHNAGMQPWGPAVPNVTGG